MCGRFTQHATWSEIQEATLPLILADPEEPLLPSWNVAPSQRAYVIAPVEDELRLLTPKWGFAPSWATGTSAPINARAEGVGGSRMFRGAFARSRCVVPSNGWYEWKIEAEGQPKQPYLFEPVEAPLLYLAAIRTGDTFAIVTTEGIPESTGIHDRSPGLIAHEDLQRWLAADTPLPEIQTLLVARPAGWVRARTVDRSVGNPRNNGPDLLG